jgi:hypothetical protein
VSGLCPDNLFPDGSGPPLEMETPATAATVTGAQETSEFQQTTVYRARLPAAIATWTINANLRVAAFAAANRVLT